MRIRLSAALALISFAATSSSANSEATSSAGKPTTAQEDNDSAFSSTAEETNRKLKRRGKGAKNAKSGKAAKKDEGGQERINKLLDCAKRLLGNHIYDGPCGKTFVAAIGCRDENYLEDCYYHEMSRDGSTSQGVCAPFNMEDVLAIGDGNTCQFGYNAEIHLQESDKPLDRNCVPKYTVKISTRLGKRSSDAPLHIVFSSDGGETWYNEEDPRVAARVESDDDLHSRRALQTGRESCTEGTGSIRESGSVSAQYLLPTDQVTVDMPCGGPLGTVTFRCTPRGHIRYQFPCCSTCNSLVPGDGTKPLPYDNPDPFGELTRTFPVCGGCYAGGTQCGYRINPLSTKACGDCCAGDNGSLFNAKCRSFPSIV